MNRDELRAMFVDLVEALNEPAAPFARPRRNRAIDDEHAERYEAAADVLRRRAARRRQEAERAAGAGGGEGVPLAEMADDEEVRAAAFAERARLIRAGEPMPRRLRTPAQSLELVDALRGMLLSFLHELDAYDDLAVDELDAFASALDASPIGERVTEHAHTLRAHAFALLELVGVRVDASGAIHCASYRSPLRAPPLPEELQTILVALDP